MTSTNSTVVNFSLLDLLFRVRRIDLLSEVSVNFSDTFNFPRANRTSLNATPKTAQVNKKIDLPSDESIEKIIHTALQEAKKLCQKLKINIVNPSTFPKIATELNVKSQNLDKIIAQDEETDEDEIDINNELQENLCEESEDASCLEIQSESEGESEVESNSEIETEKSLKISNKVEIIDEKGNKRLIRKSTLCWLLSSGGESLSSESYTASKTKVADECGE